MQPGVIRTGRREASASSRAMLNPSLKDGSAKRSAAAKAASLSSPYIGPVSATDCVMPRSAAFLSLVLALDAAVFILCERIANSPYGRLLKSIRDDEDAALVLGKNVTRVKGQVFIVGSALAGLAGSLYAYYVGYVNPDDFTPAVTFIVWVMVMLGGRANNLGVVLGTTIIVLIDRLSTLLDNFLTQLPFDPNYLRWLITGILMLTVLMIRPHVLNPENPFKTPAWEVVRNGDSEDGESG